MSYQYRESKKATPEDIVIKLFKTNEKKKTLKQQEKNWHSKCKEDKQELLQISQTQQQEARK